MCLKMLLTKDSLHHLLDIPEEHTSLVSLRHSKRAKRLLFKFSVRNGVEIVLPRLFEESWVVDSITKRKTLILKRVDELDKDNSKAIFISTPRGKNNWFSDFFYRGFSDEFKEVILALSTTMEGQTTSHVIADKLESFKDLTVTRLAQGIPIGGEVHYLDENTLNTAFQSRKKII